VSQGTPHPSPGTARVALWANRMAIASAPAAILWCTLGWAWVRLAPESQDVVDGLLMALLGGQLGSAMVLVAVALAGGEPLRGRLRRSLFAVGATALGCWVFGGLSKSQPPAVIGGTATIVALFMLTTGETSRAWLSASREQRAHWLAQLNDLSSGRLDIARYEAKWAPQPGTAPAPPTTTSQAEERALVASIDRALVLGQSYQRAVRFAGFALCAGLAVLLVALAIERAAVSGWSGAQEAFLPVLIFAGLAIALRWSAKRRGRREASTVTALQALAAVHGGTLRRGLPPVFEWLHANWPEHALQTTTFSAGHGHDISVAIVIDGGPVLVRVRDLDGGEELADISCIEILVPRTPALSPPPAALPPQWANVDVPGGVHLVCSGVDDAWLSPAVVAWIVAAARRTPSR
jgi:hypothetical protein